jgi:arsenate reductase-like glutaredoxin family protein
MRVRICEYSKCSTCRKALKFLDNSNVAYEKVPIVETPPTKAELKRMLALQGGNLKKLFKRRVRSIAR